MNTAEKRKEFEHLKRIGTYKTTGKCAICGCEGETILHHIIPLCSPRGNNSVNNVIELCCECHKEAHGGLNIVSHISETMKEINRKRQTKTIKIKYDFTDVDEELIGEVDCKGNNESIDFINSIIKIVNDLGYYMKWAKTSSKIYASYGARKIINAQAVVYNDEYKVCKRNYDFGYFEIYIPYKKGIA